VNIFFKNKEDLKLINAVKFILGYKPKKIQLYKLALLHKSNNSEESNERLEYLGDAVLGLIVANYLFKLYPYKDEGFLTKIRSKIVSRDSLNNLGRKIGIKELINLQKAKTKSY
jgi:ribonuclease-3